eukprot:TRINITY_DN11686_c0_g1_i3.p2 TRINITY_DN11686_c0_g1~~TRINITY_DN11686_c0_g1_i3.p2  ORF type:complete len:155 (-),score=30.71 TRINITY_DN11686_c0_g1_i3:218-682(-)
MQRDTWSQSQTVSNKYKCAPNNPPYYLWQYMLSAEFPSSGQIFVNPQIFAETTGDYPKPPGDWIHTKPGAQSFLVQTTQHTSGFMQHDKKNTEAVGQEEILPLVFNNPSLTVAGYMIEPYMPAGPEKAVALAAAFMFLAVLVKVFLAKLIFGRR